MMINYYSPKKKKKKNIRVNQTYSHVFRADLYGATRGDNSGNGARCAESAARRILRFAFGIRFLDRPGFSHGQVYQESGSAPR